MFRSAPVRLFAAVLGCLLFGAVLMLLSKLIFEPRVQAGHELALPSGKKVMILSSHLIDDNGGTLMLRYQTDNIYDIAARREEVDEIWPLYRPQASWAYAEIVASELPQGEGFQRTARGTKFVYKRSKDGTWQRVIDGELE